MAGDLFGEAVDDGWNRSRLTDDFLAENDDAPEDFGTPQAAPQQPQQRPKQPPRSFVPEGYKPPSAVQAELETLRRRYQRLDNKLAKARVQDDSNPYSYQGDDGQLQFDNLAYNDDMRQLGSIKMEIDTLTDKLRDSQKTAETGQQSVRQYARDFFFRMENHVEKGLREHVKQRFSYYFRDLVRTGHFERPENLSPERIDAALGNIFRASVGDAVIAKQQGKITAPKSPGTTEDDVPRKDDEDEFADWTPEAKKMFAAFQRHDGANKGTLADRKGDNR